MIDLRMITQPSIVARSRGRCSISSGKARCSASRRSSSSAPARPQRASTRYAIGVTTLALMLVTCAARSSILASAAISSADDDRSRRPPRTRGRDRSNRDVRARHGRRRPPNVDRDAVRVARSTSAPLRRGVRAARSHGAPRDRAGVGHRRARDDVAADWRMDADAAMACARRHRRVAVDRCRCARDRRAAARFAARSPILESGAVAVPTLVGWVKPVVLLPAAALSGLSPEQLQAILAHELAHVRRHDYLVNLLQSMVETLLFYHPATWWVSAQVRAEREHCCDDLAVEVCGDRLVYVSALAELTTHRQPSRPSRWRPPMDRCSSACSAFLAASDRCTSPRRRGRCSRWCCS